MTNEILKRTKEALDRAIAEKRMNQEVMRSLGPAILDTLRPVLEQIADNSRLSKEELTSVLSQIKIDIPKIDVPRSEVDVRIPEIKVPKPEVTVNVPEIKIPEIKIPKIATPKVPKPEITVNVPKITIPDLKWPKETMPIDGWVRLMGIDLDNPLPVQLRDSQGRPVSMPDGGGSSSPVRSVVSIKKPENVHIYNVNMIAGDTEYSQELPRGTIAMTLQNREDNDIRLSYLVGRVATSTSAFMTIKGGQTYYETNVNLSNKIIYVASGRAGVAEIIAYY